MANVIPIGVQASFATAGGVFGSEVKIQLALNATRVLGGGVTATAAGTRPAWFMILCSPNDFVEYTPDAGTTFRTLIATGGTGIILADGLGNVRLSNAGMADAGSVFTYVTEVLFC